MTITPTVTCISLLFLMVITGGLANIEAKYISNDASIAKRVKRSQAEQQPQPPLLSMQQVLAEVLAEEDPSNLNSNKNIKKNPTSKTSKATRTLVEVSSSRTQVPNNIDKQLEQLLSPSCRRLVVDNTSAANSRMKTKQTKAEAKEHTFQVLNLFFHPEGKERLEDYGPSEEDFYCAFAIGLVVGVEKPLLCHLEPECGLRSDRAVLMRAELDREMVNPAMIPKGKLNEKKQCGDRFQRQLDTLLQNQNPTNSSTDFLQCIREEKPQRLSTPCRRLVEDSRSYQLKVPASVELALEQKMRELFREHFGVAFGSNKIPSSATDKTKCDFLIALQSLINKEAACRLVPECTAQDRALFVRQHFINKTFSDGFQFTDSSSSCRQEKENYYWEDEERAEKDFQCPSTGVIKTFIRSIGAVGMLCIIWIAMLILLMVIFRCVEKTLDTTTAPIGGGGAGSPATPTKKRKKNSNKKHSSSLPAQSSTQKWMASIVSPKSKDNYTRNSVKSPRSSTPTVNNNSSPNAKFQHLRSKSVSTKGGIKQSSTTPTRTPTTPTNSRSKTKPVNIGAAATTATTGSIPTNKQRSASPRPTTSPKPIAIAGASLPNKSGRTAPPAPLHSPAGRHREDANTNKTHAHELEHAAAATGAIGGGGKAGGI